MRLWNVHQSAPAGVVRREYLGSRDCVQSMKATREIAFNLRRRLTILLELYATLLSDAAKVFGVDVRKELYDALESTTVTRRLDS